MSKAGLQQYSKEVRDRIIDISRRIVFEEGLDAISIRRVANEMDYSAGIIYHYFRGKDELLSCAVREGYRKMLLTVKMPDADLSPDEKLRETFRNFIDTVMQAPDAYKSFASNFSSGLFRDLAIQGDGDNEDYDSPTFSWIVSYIKEGNDAGLFACNDPILAARAFWCAGYGLLFRVLMDVGMSLEERDTLIQYQFDILLKGISA
jgi:AcrR family transcriptional regulator